MKDKTTALILSILVGALGVDRFYLGYTGMGILKLLTGGCFGIFVAHRPYQYRHRQAPAR